MVEKRDLDELQHRQNVLIALLESIRTGDQAKVDEILSAVRSGRSRQEIIAALSEITGVKRGGQARNGANGGGSVNGSSGGGR